MHRHADLASVSRLATGPASTPSFAQAIRARAARFGTSPAGVRPEYRGYSAFVSDPDGNNVESVYKE